MCDIKDLNNESEQFARERAINALRFELRTFTKLRSQEDRKALLKLICCDLGFNSVI